MPLLILAGVGAVAGFFTRGKLDSAFDFFSGADASPKSDNSGLLNNPWALLLLGVAAGVVVFQVID